MGLLKSDTSAARTRTDTAMMSPFFLVLLVLVWVVFIYVLWPLSRLVVSRFRSPLRLLPSPPSPSYLMGHLAQVSVEENNNIFQKWTELYGRTFTYRGFVNGYRLLTTDPLALAYILGHAYDFPKPDFITDALAEACAGHEGLLTAQGDIHRRQVCLSLSNATTSHSNCPPPQRRILVLYSAARPATTSP
jgi:hypothetical protein